MLFRSFSMLCGKPSIHVHVYLLKGTCCCLGGTPLGELALAGPGPLTVIGPTELGRLGGTEDGLSLFVEDGVEGHFEDGRRSELDCCCAY